VRVVGNPPTVRRPPASHERDRACRVAATQPSPCYKPGAAGAVEHEPGGESRHTAACLDRDSRPAIVIPDRRASDVSRKPTDQVRASFDRSVAKHSIEFLTLDLVALFSLGERLDPRTPIGPPHRVAAPGMEPRAFYGSQHAGGVEGLSRTGRNRFRETAPGARVVHEDDLMPPRCEQARRDAPGGAGANNDHVAVEARHLGESYAVRAQTSSG
jgi:hypothetical protein